MDVCDNFHVWVEHYLVTLNMMQENTQIVGCHWWPKASRYYIYSGSKVQATFHFLESDEKVFPPHPSEGSLL